MDARIFCKQRPEEGHRKLCCYVLVLFFFLTFFFFYFLFPLLLVSHQIEAGSWFTMAPKMDKTTRYWSWPHKMAMPEVLSAAPESAQGPGLHWDAKVRILGCWDVRILGYWDTGMCSMPGPWTTTQVPIPSSWPAVQCLSPPCSFSCRICILFPVFDLAPWNFPSLPRPSALSEQTPVSAIHKAISSLHTARWRGRPRCHAPPPDVCSSPFPSLLFSSTTAKALGS